MKLFEQRNLPGVGTKYSFVTDRNEALITLVHDEGKREIYHFAGPDPDSSRRRDVIELSELEAERLGSILAGEYYRPALAKRMEMALEGIHIEWVEVAEGSTVEGKTIGELEIRRTTGTSIVAIIHHDEEPVVNPGPDYRFRAEDVVVLIGRGPDISSFYRVAAPPGR